MKRFKKSIFILIITISLGFVLAACASEPDESSDGDAGDETKASSDDLIIATLSDAVSLDPAGSNDVPSSQVQKNIYETLIVQNADMELEPGLATEWEAVEDNIWEFKLREDVTFHDGTEFNAEVVKANIGRIIDEKVGSPRGFLYEMVEKIEVVDDYTVRFITKYPFAPLPAHLAHNGGGMVSLKVIEEDYKAIENGEAPGSVINKKPIGTGYFKFEEWKADKHIKLSKNEDYWGEKAKLKTVTFKVVGEDQTRIAELLTGDSHIADPVSPSDIAQVDNEEGLFVNRQGSTSLSYIGFNMEKEPFDDPKVRQAINMAVDKKQIIEGIYDGSGIAAKGPLAPDVFGYDESVEGLEYDVEKAKELLKEAGYKDGFKTTIWTNDDRERIDTATNIQAQLKEIGIDVEVEILEWGAYLDKTANGEHDMFVLGWSIVTGDADYGLYPLFHSSNVGNPGNRTFTKDPELDKLLDGARQNPDPKERIKLYKEIQEMLTDIAPMLYIHHKEYLVGVNEKVKGFTQTPTGIFELQNVTIEE